MTPAVIRPRPTRRRAGGDSPFRLTDSVARPGAGLLCLIAIRPNDICAERRRVACAGAMIAQATLQAAYFDDVDYTKLKSRLGAGHADRRWRDDLDRRRPRPGRLARVLTWSTCRCRSSTSTTDPTGAGVHLTDGSGVAHTGFSAHATNTVGQFYFGNTQSVAPGRQQRHELRSQSVAQQRSAFQRQRSADAANVSRAES